MENTFSEWLLEQMKLWGMSQSDLARKSGLTRSTISYYLSSKSKYPDEFALRKIAKAFLLSPETVLRAANILPTESPESELINQISHLTSELPEQEQQDILEFIKLRHRLAEERGKNATRKTASLSSTPK